MPSAKSLRLIPISHIFIFNIVFCPYGGLKKNTSKISKLERSVNLNNLAVGKCCFKSVIRGFKLKVCHSEGSYNGWVSRPGQHMFKQKGTGKKRVKCDPVVDTYPIWPKKKSFQLLFFLLDKNKLRSLGFVCFVSVNCGMLEECFGIWVVTQHHFVAKCQKTY